MTTPAIWTAVALLIVGTIVVIARQRAKRRVFDPKDRYRRAVMGLARDRDQRALWVAGSVGIIGLGSSGADFPHDNGGTGGACGGGCGGCGGCGG